MNRSDHRIATILKNDLGVGESYQHGPKQVTPGDSIETNGAVFKWYAVHPEELPVPDETVFPWPPAVLRRPSARPIW